MKNIIITGGNGFIGKHLVKELYGDFNFRILTRDTNLSSKKSFFYWNLEDKIIDEDIFNDLDCIIHLAGANIAEKRWTKERKKEILDSRIESIKFLYQKCSDLNVKPKTVISGSAVGFYGMEQTDKIYTESDPPGNDFLGEVCKKWEDSADLFENLNSRIIKLRIAAVLAKDGGVIEKLKPIFKSAFGSALGSGRQIFPYIHLTDLVNMIRFVLENESISGCYNAVSPEIITNLEFSKAFARSVSRPLFFLNVPSFVLKIILGELANMVLNGNVISAEKIINEGFKFNFTDIQQTLEFINKKTTS